MASGTLTTFAHVHRSPFATLLTAASCCRQFAASALAFITQIYSLYGHVKICLKEACGAVVDTHMKTPRPTLPATLATFMTPYTHILRSTSQVMQRPCMACLLRSHQRASSCRSTLR